jgi:hypothetical protein
MVNSTENPIYVLEVMPVELAGVRPEKLSLVDGDKFRQAFDGLLANIKYMCQQSEKLMEGYVINDITFRVGVNAEGGLAFISKAGIQADIEIKVTRKP